MTMGIPSKKFKRAFYRQKHAKIIKETGDTFEQDKKISAIQRSIEFLTSKGYEVRKRNVGEPILKLTRETLSRLCYFIGISRFLTGKENTRKVDVR